MTPKQTQFVAEYLANWCEASFLPLRGLYTIPTRTGPTKV